jgi:hypothetical protein
MNFLETIGLFAILCVGLALINEFIKAVDKTKAEHERVSNEMNAASGSGGSVSKLATTSREVFENLKEEISRVDENQKIRFHDASWYDSQTEYEAVINVYKNKLPFMGGEEKRDLFKRLGELSPEVWGDIALDIRRRDEGNLGKTKNEK